MKVSCEVSKLCNKFIHICVRVLQNSGVFRRKPLEFCYVNNYIILFLDKFEWFNMERAALYLINNNYRF